MRTWEVNRGVSEWGWWSAAVYRTLERDARVNASLAYATLYDDPTIAFRIGFHGYAKNGAPA